MMLMGNICANQNISAEQFTYMRPQNVISRIYSHTGTYSHQIGPQWPSKPTKIFQSRLESILQKGEFTLEEIQAIYDGIDKHDYTLLGREHKRYRDLEQIINNLRETKFENGNRRLKTVKRTYVESKLIPPMVFYGFDFFDSVEQDTATNSQTHKH